MGKLDPVTFSVIRNRFEAIGEEMSLALERTAWSSVLSLARDYSCMIYDADPRAPRQITMAECLPIHCNSFSMLLTKILDTFGDDIHDGDVFLTNDPYGGNTHIPDLVTAMPVFVDGKNSFWSVARGHQIDCGAAEAASVIPSATTIYQEGIVIPPIKIFDRGVERYDIISLYLANVRYRDALNGDLRAQLGGIGVARKELIKLCAKYGRDEVFRYVEGLMDYAERRAREEFKGFPDGVFEGTTWSDTDGLGKTDIPIRVKVTIENGGIHVDFSESGPQSAGSANGTHAIMQATSTVPFLYYIDPDIPHNHGVLKHISAAAKPGTICLAQYPAATGGATTNPADPMHEVINIAMAQAIPDRVPAGSAHTSHVPNFSGTHPETGEPWGCMLFNGGGGQGAAKGADGWPLFHTLGGMGGLTSGSIEQVEMMYPLVIDTMEIETDAFGFGEWNGGPGIRTRYRPVGDRMECVTGGEGCRNPPHGVNGGTMSPGGGIYIEHADGTRTFMSSAAHVYVAKGETWNGVSPGGGGWGNPVARPAERVRSDVRNGIISEAVASDIFGVVLNDDFERSLDIAATEALRSELSKIARPPLEPLVPNAGTWLANNMTANDRYVEAPTIETSFNEQ